MNIPSDDEYNSESSNVDADFDSDNYFLPAGLINDIGDLDDEYDGNEYDEYDDSDQYHGSTTTFRNTAFPFGYHTMSDATRWSNNPPLSQELSHSPPTTFLTQPQSQYSSFPQNLYPDRLPLHRSYPGLSQNQPINPNSVASYLTPQNMFGHSISSCELSNEHFFGGMDSIMYKDGHPVLSSHDFLQQQQQDVAASTGAVPPPLTTSTPSPFKFSSGSPGFSSASYRPSISTTSTTSSNHTTTTNTSAKVDSMIHFPHDHPFAIPSLHKTNNNNTNNNNNNITTNNNHLRNSNGNNDNNNNSKDGDHGIKQIESVSSGQTSKNNQQSNTTNTSTSGQNEGGALLPATTDAQKANSNTSSTGGKQTTRTRPTKQRKERKQTEKRVKQTIATTWVVKGSSLPPISGSPLATSATDVSTTSSTSPSKSTDVAASSDAKLISSNARLSSPIASRSAPSVVSSGKIEDVPLPTSPNNVKNTIPINSNEPPSSDTLPTTAITVSETTTTTTSNSADNDVKKSAGQQSEHERDTINSSVANVDDDNNDVAHKNDATPDVHGSHGLLEKMSELEVAPHLDDTKHSQPPSNVDDDDVHKYSVPDNITAAPLSPIQEEEKVNHPSSVNEGRSDSVDDDNQNVADDATVVQENNNDVDDDDDDRKKDIIDEVPSIANHNVVEEPKNTSTTSHSRSEKSHYNNNNKNKTTNNANEKPNSNNSNNNGTVKKEVPKPTTIAPTIIPKKKIKRTPLQWNKQNCLSVLVMFIIESIFQLHQSALNALTVHYHVSVTILYIYAFPFLVVLLDNTNSAYSAFWHIFWYLFLFWFLCNKGYSPSNERSLNLPLAISLLFVFEGVCSPVFIISWNGGERLVLAFVLLSMKSNGFFHWSCFLSLALLIVTSVILGTNILVQWLILVMALSSLSSSFTFDPLSGVTPAPHLSQYYHDDETSLSECTPSYEGNLLPPATTVGFCSASPPSLRLPRTNKRVNKRRR